MSGSAGTSRPMAMGDDRLPTRSGWPGKKRTSTVMAHGLGTVVGPKTTARPVLRRGGRREYPARCYLWRAPGSGRNWAIWPMECHRRVHDGLEAALGVGRLFVDRARPRPEPGRAAVG